MIKLNFNSFTHNSYLEFKSGTWQFLLLLGLTISFTDTIAQNDTNRIDSTHYRHPRHKNSREYYVEDLTDKLNVCLFLFKNNTEVSLNGKTALNYQPNDNAGLGVGVRLYWLGLYLSYSPKTIQDETKGITTYTHLKLNSYGKKMGFDFYYLNYSGYFLNNTASYPALQLEINQRYLRSDLRTLNYGTNFYYIFNHKRYSYRSTFIQNEIHKRSAGSFMLSASINFYKLKADSSIVPSKLDPLAYSVAAKINNGNFFNFSVMPGYGHTFVAFKRFFLTLSAFGGLNFQQQYYKVSSEEENEKLFEKFVVIPRIMARAGFGYNSRFFYLGVNTFIDVYNLPLGPKEQINYSNNLINFYMGYHIDLPQRWQKTLHKYKKIHFLDHHYNHNK